MYKEEIIPVDPTSVKFNRNITTIRAFGRSIAHLPGMELIRQMGRKALAVTEPPRWLFMRRHPVRVLERECDLLTLMSANLWHDWPRYRDLLQRLEAFAQLVESEQVDVLMLQEVARTPAMDVDRWLANRLGMAYVYARANGHVETGFEEGPAIFSRFPLGTHYLQQLGNGSNPFIRRLALGVEILGPCGGLPVFSAHLGILPNDNKLQLEHLRRWVGAIAGPHAAVIGGDFNTAEHSVQLRQIQMLWQDTFREVNPDREANTHELRGPGGIVLSRKRLDYIFLKNGVVPWKVFETRHVWPECLYHSDHQAVLTRLALAN